MARAVRSNREQAWSAEDHRDAHDGERHAGREVGDEEKLVGVGSLDPGDEVIAALRMIRVAYADDEIKGTLKAWARGERDERQMLAR